MELLKQPLDSPLSMAEQVISLCAATSKVMLTVPKSDIKAFQTALLHEFKVNHADIIEQLEMTKKLDDELKSEIVEISKVYLGKWKAEHGALAVAG